MLEDIEQIVARNLRRVNEQPRFTLTLGPAQDPWQQLAWNGLSFIVQQWQLGFGEARHIMAFPRDQFPLDPLRDAEGQGNQSFSAPSEYQYGDVFQRAIIADVLCDANDHLHGQMQLLIDYEINYILSQRRSDTGGWSYFPALPELPPDADDLAQVMQVLVRTQRQTDIMDTCEPLLSILLDENVHADGSFETWILPVTGRMPIQERQAMFTRLAWGIGPDNDVMANLLYALVLYDWKRFAATIQHGVEYLKRQQEASGAWMSTWYHGAYYGTYVCLRLLTAVAHESTAIQRAWHFLRSQQHPDGGWGMNGESDALNTALALLGLAVIHHSARTHNLWPRDQLKGDRERAARALGYLQGCQETGKGWPSCEFIRMEMGRATGDVLRTLSYGSRTITTAYVLKAALAWQ